VTPDPKAKLLYPVTKLANVFTVETSRKYPLTPATAPQFATKEVPPILVPAVATGAEVLETIVIAPETGLVKEHPPELVTVQ
jgi:hypothetical protein